MAMSEQHSSSEQPSSEASVSDTDSLLDLAAFNERYPPREPFQERERSTIYHHAAQRVVLSWERSADVGYGLWRSEKLGEQGVFDAEHDSEQFAKGLLQALVENLSIRDLEHLKNTFAAEYERREAQRQRFIAGRP